MRLLEVQERRRKQGYTTLAIRSYALCDCHHVVVSWVEWGSEKDRVPQPEGITWDDMWALSREFVDVIYQRTGLIPRTFSKSLQRGRQDGEIVRTSWDVEEAQEVEVQDARF